MAGNSVYAIGGASDSGSYYFYTLRRDDEGNLFIGRSDVINGTTIESPFGLNKPSIFDGAFIDTNYYDGREADHTLAYTTDEVKYEQWFWDTKLASYYINSDGELVAAFGKETKWLANTDYITFNPSAIPSTYNFVLNGQHAGVNIYELLIIDGWNGVDPVEVTNNGYIFSTSGDIPAFLISGDYPYGITLINNGDIKGSPGYKASNDVSGDPGVGIEANSICDITNNGTIYGGDTYTSSPDGYAIVGISSVTLTNNGQIGTTI